MKKLISVVVSIELLGYRYLYEKLPHIPEAQRRLVAKYFPFAVTILLGWRIITLVRYISFQLITPSAAYLYPALGGGYGIVGIMLVGMAVVLAGIALPGLFTFKRFGWTYLFLSELLIILTNLIHLNIVNFLVGGLIALYILFQVRSYYHD